MPTTVKGTATAKKTAKNKAAKPAKPSSIAASLAAYLREKAPAEDVAAYEGAVLVRRITVVNDNMPVIPVRFGAGRDHRHRG
jgi:hypothetical protein